MQMCSPIAASAADGALENNQSRVAVVLEDCVSCRRSCWDVFRACAELCGSCDNAVWSEGT
jgi:hypothetical protein